MEDSEFVIARREGQMAAAPRQLRAAFTRAGGPSDQHTPRGFAPQVLRDRLAHPGALRRLVLINAGWLALALSAAGWVIVSLKVFGQPFYVGDRALRFFDLRVYRGAAVRVLGDGELYRHPIVHRLGFTYPPAAALALAPLALLPLLADKVVVSALNLMALVWMLHSTFALAGCTARRSVIWSAAALAGAAALWLEPVTVTLGYGQIDLLIVSLIVFDLARGERAPGAGVAIGIAAGLKLTPMLFLVYLALSGQRRMALQGAGAFLGTIIVSFLATGGAAARYWGGLILDSARVGGAGDVANQSLRGALARLTDSPHPGAGIELVVVVVAVVGLGLAVRAARRGQAQLGFGLCAVTTLLASPVSWTHHWTLAVPALALLATAAWQKRSAILAVTALVCTAVGFAYVPERFLTRHGFTTGLVSLAADPYVLLGLGFLTAAAATQWSLRSPSARRTARALPASR